MSQHIDTESQDASTKSPNRGLLALYRVLSATSQIIQPIWRIFATKVRPLTKCEREAGESVLGEDAIRYDDVRITSGGLLNHFRPNQLAFTIFHTIDYPGDAELDVVVHELTHVYQYERLGRRVLYEALSAQEFARAETGNVINAYTYGGVKGLAEVHKKDDSGKRKSFSEFNREQQAQIAQDYYNYVIRKNRPITEDERAAYEFYIMEELRKGIL